MGKNISKNIRKNLRGKYNQKFLDHARQSATDALKTWSTYTVALKQLQMRMIKKYLKKDI